MECEPTKYSVDKLVKGWKSAELRINPEYQRGARWTPAQQQGLVDSIFRKYPVPPLFLHQITSDGLAGPTKRFEVVDGQQRVRALADFLGDKLSLLESTDKKLRLPNSLRSISAPWGGKRFSQLETQLQNELLKTSIDVFLITRVENADEVRDLFIRLQSGTALTRQQVRDAWPGAIGPFVESMAGKLDRQPSSELFRLVGRWGREVEDDHDQYDGDRSFCAQLLRLFLARLGDPLAQQSIGANELDKLYHESTTFEPQGETAARFIHLLKIDL